MEAGPIITAVFALLSFILLIPVFCWHFVRQNVPVISLLFWMMYGSLTTFINVLIWSGPDFDTKFNGEIYCDITNNLEYGSNVGRICAVATLALNLYIILKALNPLFLDEAYRKRKNWLNFALCWVTPIFTMATVYIIQTQRYVILRYRGCASAVSLSYPTVLIIFLWKLLWSAVSVVFAVLTLYKFYVTRRDVKNILKCTNCGLSFKRFARLVSVSVFCVMTLVPWTVYTVVISTEHFNAHFDWEAVHNWPPYILFTDFGFVAMYDKLIGIGVALITFLIFGVGSEASMVYFKWFLFLFKWRKSSSTSYDSGVENGGDNGETDNDNHSHVMQQSQISDMVYCTRLDDLESNSFIFHEDNDDDEVRDHDIKLKTPTDVTVVSLQDSESEKGGL